jgi:hypothetical protein
MLLLIGAALFGAGALSFLVLLFSSGGAARSRQFALIGALWSGRLGARRRRILRLSLALVGVGALTCFAGVAASDAARAARCSEVCLARGFDTGRIGRSPSRAALRRLYLRRCEPRATRAARGRLAAVVSAAPSRRAAMPARGGIAGWQVVRAAGIPDPPTPDRSRNASCSDTFRRQVRPHSPAARDGEARHQRIAATSAVASATVTMTLPRARCVPRYSSAAPVSASG